MHPGRWLHASGALSAERTLNSVIDISLRSPCADCSINRRVVVEVVVSRRDDVDLGCRTAPRTHSNTVKQKERVRAAFCGAGKLSHSPVPAAQIRGARLLQLVQAVAHEFE